VKINLDRLMKMKRLFVYVLAVLCATVSCTKKSKLKSSDPRYTDPGVVINGVKWATRNVDSPGTFAGTPDDPGMLYQWNSRTGWNSTDDNYISSPRGQIWSDHYGKQSDSWTPENDPCPEGWRVPDVEEMAALVNARNVASEWGNRNYVSVSTGRRFTDKNTGKSLFLTASGRMWGEEANLADVGDEGDYWSSAPWSYSLPYIHTGCYCLSFDRRDFGLDRETRNKALSVRCVAEDYPEK
jgi:uncharacterized protein (TIGR02145 family)